MRWSCDLCITCRINKKNNDKKNLVAIENISDPQVYMLDNCINTLKKILRLFQMYYFKMIEFFIYAWTVTVRQDSIICDFANILSFNQF